MPTIHIPAVPADLQRRYDELIVKRQANALTDDEYSERLYLTDQIEAVDVERLRYLAELAKQRGVSLTAIMEQLDI
ncbi:MAG: hypothetical protein IT324_22900 [Anaerolineae bacterium]|nr:hypothetical protein [Anaerolineae bacterium]